MKTHHKKILVCLLCLSTFIAGAQIVDPTAALRRKLEQKINAKINKKIDDKVDSITNKQVDTTTGRLGKMLDFDVKPKSSYAFTSSVLQKVTVINKSKNEVSYMKMLFSKGQPALSMRLLDKNQLEDGEKGTMIMDLEQKAFFTFGIDKKGNKNYFGMRLKEQPIQDTETTTTAKSEKNFIKTGRTKTIMGYICEGYQMDNDNGDATIFWVTTSSVAGMDDYYQAMRQYSTQQKQQSSFTYSKSITDWAKQGKAVLGNDHIRKNGDQTLTELEKIVLNDPSNFSTEGYRSAFNK